MDKYYTPPTLAASMLSSVINPPHLVADFAAGGGALLRAARSRWPNSILVGTDNDPQSVRKLKREGFVSGRCDFLSKKSRTASKILLSLKQKANLILLNPPFSCKGGSYQTALFNGKHLKCSRALFFLIQSLDYLAPDGLVICVMPASTLSSCKDQDAWNLLSYFYNIKVAGRNNRRTFSKCFSETALIELYARTPSVQPSSFFPPAIPAQPARHRLIRGTLPTYLTGKAGNPINYIHTTGIQSGVVYYEETFSVNTGRSIIGPAVLICRVGKPLLSKIGIYISSTRLTLSDCIIAIQCISPSHAAHLYCELKHQWELLEDAYDGTCCKYITVNRLQLILEQLEKSKLIPVSGSDSTLGDSCRSAG